MKRPMVRVVSLLLSLFSESTCNLLAMAMHLRGFALVHFTRPVHLRASPFLQKIPSTPF